MAHRYQETDVFCGAAALQMALERAGHDAPSQAKLADQLGTDLAGTHPEAFERFLLAAAINHKAWHGDVTLQDLAALNLDHAIIVCYQSKKLRVGHFALLDEITDREVRLADPWFGPETCIASTEFMAQWESRPHNDKPRQRWLLAIPVREPPTID